MNLFAADKVYTVLELNNTVKALFKREFPDYIWVCGEIQDYRDKGHSYFSLVQKHAEANEIAAAVSVSLFRNYKPKIFKRLQEADNAFELANDIEAKFLCEVSLYPRTGKYSLIAVDIDPVYTLGRVAQNRLKIVESLKRKGLLERNKLVAMPAVPLRVGLITAVDSQAYHDFTNELTVAGRGFKVLVYNAHMQGKEVEADVVRALKLFARAGGVDVIALTRGGGSKADLSWFDNEKIAEAIALSPFPVLTGLGHHLDVSIADMVAHTSLKTPTKLAQFIAQAVADFAQELDSLREAILTRAQEIFLDKRRTLATNALKLDSTCVRYFQVHKDELVEKKHAISKGLQVALSESRHRLTQAAKSLGFYSERLLTRARDLLRSCQAQVKLLDPKNVLKRGYSLTLKQGRALKSIDEVNQDDIIRTVLFRGAIVSRVQRKESDNEQKDY